MKLEVNLTHNPYDIIIEKKNVIFATPEVDLTQKITDKLNAMK